MDKANLLKYKTGIGFAQIPNKLVTDTRLCNGAFRVLCLLFTKPPNWKIYNKYVCTELGIKKVSTLSKYWKECLDSGWMEREKVLKSEDGRVGTYIYYLNPNFDPPKLVSSKMVDTKMVYTKMGEHNNTIINNNKSNTLKSITKSPPNINFFKNIEGLEDINHVHITIEQYNKLVARYSIDIVHQKIRALEDWQLNKPKKDKKTDHYSALNNWCGISFVPTQNKKYETVADKNKKILTQDINQSMSQNNGVINPDDFVYFGREENK
tara:strand:- start:402 stop:1199 length:798 start_codon:yes stop_codon:yes gene_type:complete